MTDWKAKTLAHWRDINSLAVHRFGDNPLAEEAALAVIEGLRADDWKKVRSYSGKSSFSTFLRVVVVRLLEDFARKRYGRIRAPLWVRTFGGIWEKLFELLCLQRMSVMEAVETVKQYGVKKYAELEDAAYHLLEKIPHCGQHQGLEVAYEERGDAGALQHSGANNSYEQKQQKEVFSAVFTIVFGSSEVSVTGELLRKFSELKLRLTSQEKLMLKLCFQEEMSVTGAGKLLGLTRFQAHGKMRRLMKRLHQEFDRVGLTEELKHYL